MIRCIIYIREFIYIIYEKDKILTELIYKRVNNNSFTLKLVDFKVQGLFVYFNHKYRPLPLVAGAYLVNINELTNDYHIINTTKGKVDFYFQESTGQFKRLNTNLFRTVTPIGPFKYQTVANTMFFHRTVNGNLAMMLNTVPGIRGYIGNTSITEIETTPIAMIWRGSMAIQLLTVAKLSLKMIDQTNNHGIAIAAKIISQVHNTVIFEITISKEKLHDFYQEFDLKTATILLNTYLKLTFTELQTRQDMVKLQGFSGQTRNELQNILVNRKPGEKIRDNIYAKFLPIKALTTVLENHQLMHFYPYVNSYFNLKVSLSLSQSETSQLLRNDKQRALNLAHLKHVEPKTGMVVIDINEDLWKKYSTITTILALLTEYAFKSVYLLAPPNLDLTFLNTKIEAELHIVQRNSDQAIQSQAQAAWLIDNELVVRENMPQQMIAEKYTITDVTSVNDGLLIKVDTAQLISQNKDFYLVITNRDNKDQYYLASENVAEEALTFKISNTILITEIWPQIWQQQGLLDLGLVIDNRDHRRQLAELPRLTLIAATPKLQAKITDWYLDLHANLDKQLSTKIGYDSHVIKLADENNVLVLTPYINKSLKLTFAIIKVKQAIHTKLVENGVPIPIAKTPDSRIASYYAELITTTEVIPQTILYESRDGQTIVDSPLAIFDYLKKDTFFANYQHIWVINNPDNPTIHELDEYQQDNVKVVIRNTAAYFKAMATANYLITNATLPAFFVKQPQQIIVNTWHGTPLKHMGFDMPGDPGKSKNVVRNFLMADYLISPNTHTTNILLNGYKLAGLFTGKIIENGYPRIDFTLNANQVQLKQQLTNLGIKLDNNKKVIAWTPTWKGEAVNAPTDDIASIIKSFKQLQTSLPAYNVVLKVHPFIYDLIRNEPSLVHSLIPDSFDPNKFLGLVDILITDYSSIFFDYLATKKPIIFFVPDKDAYQAQRGLYLKEKNLPGPIERRLANVIDDINNIDIINLKYQQQYAQIAADMVKYDDGQTTKKYVDAIFKGQTNNLKIIQQHRFKKRILIYPGSLAKNGITTSYINLMSNLDFTQYDVTQIGALATDGGLENTLKVPKNVRQMFLVGAPLLTVNERLEDAYNNELGVNDPTFYPQIGYERNMRRLLGNQVFDVAIDYSGYSFYWAHNIVAAKATKHIIFMHNDLAADALRKIGDYKPHYQNLTTLFTLLKKFDLALSVSPALRDINAKKLKAYIKPRKIKAQVNTLNLKNLEQALAVDVTQKFKVMENIFGETIVDFDENVANFVVSARLSPEKNHLNLIEAFAKYVTDIDYTARLYCLGQGPLARILQDKIINLHMEKHIFLVGYLDKPFEFIRKTDYFILPSLWEGQPMVLLEAMTLGKKILATNIATNQYVIGRHEKYGCLTNGTTVAAIFKGLIKLVKSTKRYKQFNAEKYNKQAIRNFYRYLR